jgi:hypothetical protein
LVYLSLLHLLFIQSLRETIFNQNTKGKERKENKNVYLSAERRGVCLTIEEGGNGYWNFNGGWCYNVTLRS